MSGKTASGEIITRFLEERDYIAQYIAFLATHVIEDRSIAQLNKMLKSFGIPPLPIRKSAHGPMSQAYLNALLEAISAAEIPLNKHYFDLEERIQKFEEPIFAADEEYSQYGHLTQEIMSWLTFRLPADHTDADVESAIQYAMNNAEADTTIPEDVLRYVYTYSAEYLRGERLIMRRDAIFQMEGDFAHIRLIARTSNPEAELNIHRQAFILLMTAFDATIFDLVEGALRGPLFGFVPFFGKDAVATSADIQAATNLEEVRAAVVEKSFEGIRLQRLLSILQGLGVQLTTNKKDEADLTEIINRRNLHVHSRGVVDKQYASDKRHKTPLKVGVFATIDKPYFERAIDLTTQAVEAVAAWIASNPTPPAKAPKPTP